MYGYGNRVKRVTDPFDDKVKARIIGCDHHHRELGYISSGSDHSAHYAYHDYADSSSSSSPSFSDLVFGLPDQDESSPENKVDPDSERDFSMYDDSKDAVVEEDDDDVVMKPIFHRSDLDLFRDVLFSNVSKALEVFSCLKSDKSMLRRNVMAYLRNFGYNAAICKTKWESSGGLTAGNYEFIDVIRSDSSSSSANNRVVRYFVDLDFAAEFEIARPTSHYERLSQSLPKVFVGKIDEMKQILKVMSDAARRSLKTKGLHLSPWRKHRFMQNKWFGAYKRTTNVFQSANSPALSSPAAKLTYAAVDCRYVGFDAAADNDRLLFPATTRTR